MWETCGHRGLNGQGLGIAEALAFLRLDAYEQCLEVPCYFPWGTGHEANGRRMFKDVFKRKEGMVHAVTQAALSATSNDYCLLPKNKFEGMYGYTTV